MKLIIRSTIFLLLTLLTACTTQTITCGEGLILQDGVCQIDDQDELEEENETPPDEEEDPVTNDALCETNLDDYQGSNYTLVWSDEFDYTGALDDTKWEYLIGNGGSYGIPGWGNNEQQYYTDDLDNVSVEDGILTITASTEGYAQYGYTSGRIRTMNKGDFEYGIIEVCAQMPSTLGTWPAIWMLPTDSPYGGWPTGGEIDIMEAVGFETDIVHFNIHTLNDNWGTSQSVGSHSTISNIASEYHRYGLKWTEETIIFYVDGIEHFRYTPTAYSYQYWPFDTEFHLILNIAVGGTWGGQRGIEDGEWEDSMYVDYVRVYQEE